MIIDILAWAFLGLCAAVVAGFLVYLASIDEFMRFLFIAVVVSALVILAIGRVS